MLHTRHHLLVTTRNSSSTLIATTRQQAHRLAERAVASKHITSNLLNQVRLDRFKPPHSHLFEAAYAMHT